MVKVLISIPEDLLQEIDAAVDRGMTTRSAFLQNAARDALAAPSPARIQDALERGRAAIAALGAFESAGLIRADRDVRDLADRRR